MGAFYPDADMAEGAGRSRRILERTLREKGLLTTSRDRNRNINFGENDGGGEQTIRTRPRVPVPDANRGQYGMSTRLVKGGGYDRLLMSLQSPLPNDQDMAISVCTFLSNETKHVLKLPKEPKIVDLLLAHAGIFNQCKLREVMEESYMGARDLSHGNFWLENVPEGPSRHLLCESFVEKQHHSIGINDFGDTVESDSKEPDMTDEERGIYVNRKKLIQSEQNYSRADCCARCPCRRGKSENPSDPFPTFDQTPQPVFLLRKSAYCDDRVGQRITQIANILRNLSFEDDNAAVMARNPTLLRFILVASECEWGTISQLVLDLLGNLSQFYQLKDPAVDPLSSRVLSLVINGLFAEDRFRILRSLESLRELCKKDGNELILNQYVKRKVYKRLCELLTISDIMLLIYTLECLLTMTGLGEPICSELCRVQGSVLSLLSLVTVEAQSYGPKGCILMRVVETVTGMPQQSGVPQAIQATANHSNAAVSQNIVQARATVPIPTLTSASAMHTVTATPGQSHPSLVSQLQQPVQAQTYRQTFQVSTPAGSSVQLSRDVYPSSTAFITPAGSQVMSGSGLKIAQSTAVPGQNVMAQISTNATASGTPQTVRIMPNAAQQDGLQSANNPSVAAANGPSGMKPQIGAQMVLQSVTLPLVTPQGNLSEEGWALAWLKGAFEAAPGSSIEQGEAYRLYSQARKNPQKVLPLEQFTQCMRAAHGTTVGPVIKQLGGGSALHFFESVRPKISTKLTTQSGVMSTMEHSINRPHIVVNQITAGGGAAAESSGTPAGVATVTSSGSTSSQTNDKTSLSPILQATLSRPPKPKTPVGQRKSKVVIQRDQSASLSTMSPASSAIRSLLASKVAQRQQRKLEEVPSGGSGDFDIKMNVDGNCDEESSASSSVPGNGEVELNGSTNLVPANPDSVTSFQGVLQNGIKAEDTDVEESADLKYKAKGMLNHLLEQKVPKENINGLLCNREIRISDKGLELVDSVDETPSSAVTRQSAVLVDGSDNQSQMTFYAAPAESQVTTIIQQAQSVHQNAPMLASVNVNGTSGGGGVAWKGIHDSSSNNLGARSNQHVKLEDGSRKSNTALLSSTVTSASNNATAPPDDLYEKFNQFSDLIMVSPEQFGIKRSNSVSQDGNSDSSEPPQKKAMVAINGHGHSMSTSEAQQNISSSTPVLQAALASNSGTVQNQIPTSIAINPGTMIQSSSISPTQSIGKSVNVVAQSVQQCTQPQTMQLRVAAVNSPNQLTFSRQLVLPSGQQVIIQPQNQLQGQVIIQKPSTSSNDQMAKAILILKQPGNASLQHQAGQLGPGGQAVLHTSGQTITMPLQQISGTLQTYRPTAVQHIPQPVLIQQQPGSSNPVVQQSTVVPPATQTQAVSSTLVSSEAASMQQISRPSDPQGGVPAAHVDNSGLDGYLCEWAGCGQRFNTANKVFLHASKRHLPESLTEAVRCQWGPHGCDPLLRKRLSLMTHIQDRHCTKQALELALHRRRNKIEAPPPPVQAVHPHLGYAPNAAFHAIRRHAMQFTNPKELMDDNEGPVTKSIRLTSSLILKNIVLYSSSGRRILCGYEPQLAAVAMSNVESSRTIAQLLYDLKELKN